MKARCYNDVIISKEARDMKNRRMNMVSLAMQSLFDIEGTAARAYLKTIKVDFISPETGMVRARDVSPEGAFRAAGYFIRKGIMRFEQKYPSIAHEVRSVYLPR